MKLPRPGVLRKWGVFLLFAAMLLGYPLAWLRLWPGTAVPFFGEVTGFGGPELGLLALGVLILSPERWIGALRRSRMVLIWSLLLGTVTAGAFFQSGRGSVTATLFYTALPLAGFALSREVRRYALPFAAILFVPFLLSVPFAGRSGGPLGNWNWSFTVFAVTFPAFVLVAVRSRFRRGVILAAGAVMLPCGCLYFLPELFPGGTMAAVAGATLGVAVLWKMPASWRKPAAALGVVVLAAGFLVLLHGLPADSPSSRVQLWRAAFDLGADSGFAGVGALNFGTRIMPYLGEAYYRSDYAATLHPHPHNEILFIWCTLGLTGLAAWLLTAGQAVSAARRRSCAQWYSVWLFLVLFLHGMVDVLLREPGPGAAFLLAGGALYGARYPAKAELPFPKIRCVCGALLIFLASFFAVLGTLAGREFRQAKLALARYAPQRAMEHMERSLALRPTVPSLYTAGMIELFDLKSPERAAGFWHRIETQFGQPFYLHSNGYLARAYASQKLEAAARLYFAREREAYPFSVLNSGFELAFLEQIHADPAETAQARARLTENLRLRGLPSGAVLLFIRNPQLDDRPLPRRSRP